MVLIFSRSCLSTRRSKVVYNRSRKLTSSHGGIWPARSGETRDVREQDRCVVVAVGDHPPAHRVLEPVGYLAGRMLPAAALRARVLDFIAASAR